MSKNEKMELLVRYEKFVFTFRHSEFVIDGDAEKVRKIIVDSINQPEGDCDGNPVNLFGDEK